MKNIKKSVAEVFCFLFTFVQLFSQNLETPNSSVQLIHDFSGSYTLVERSDWSQYVNGKYIGLTSREAHGYLNPVENSNTAESSVRYSGSFFVFQQTKRNNIESAQGLDEIQNASFVVNKDNSVLYDTACFYPQLRNFPVFPQDEVKKGSRWQSMAERVVDPKNDGNYTVFQIPVEYEFQGEEIYHEKPVYRIKAKFATRFNRYNPPKIRDGSMTQATGTHDVNILVDKETCAVIMILDRMDETFGYSDGTTIRYRGNVSLFTEIPVKVEKQELYEKAIYIATGGKSGGSDSSTKGSDGFSGTNSSPEKESGSDGSYGDSGFGKDNGQEDLMKDKFSDSTGAFHVEDTDQGIRLSVRNLQFYADSDKLLPGEESRLDAVAEVLRSVTNGMFLIEGHTAAVGRPEGEKNLSVERAKTVINELVKRGFRPEQFMFFGHGGTKPIADNNTEEGRAANRRVEITILN